jgi:MFS family permease
LSNLQRPLSLGLIAFVLALCYGIWYAYGVFMVALLAEFGWSRSLAAGAFSVFTLVHGAANPAIGVLCDRLRPERLMAGGGLALGIALWADSYIESPWQLYLGFGVITAGAVAACGWVPAVVLVQRRFQDRLGLALGIVSSGVGAGMLFVVPLCQALIDAYGWRATFRVLGVICAVCIVPAAWYLARLASSPSSAGTPAAASAARSGARSLTLGEAARTAPFWLIFGLFFFGTLSSQTLHVHQVAFLVDHGMTAIAAASVVGVVGFSSIVGKVGGGWLSDRVERELVVIAGLFILVGSFAALLAVGAAPTRWGAYGYAAMLGVGYSVTAALLPALASDRFSGPSFGAIIGAGLFASALGSALGPWLAGLVFDLTGSYTIAFGIAAGCSVVAAAAAWIARDLRRAAR